ncbi:hypothetical protein [Aestuariispira ectoiniformans]|uniref:hypothetical protein n=1 Tax=Aestuariispira ectoiniformans TaxID=2775080 RepID=UPI00223AA230|nr:hypothetical protein [Aestuariispira ectoiniformans]
MAKTDEEKKMTDMEVRDEGQRRLRRKNMALLVAIVALMVILYFVTLIRTGSL